MQIFKHFFKGWKVYDNLKKAKERKDINRQKYLVNQHNQILRKRCKLPVTKQIAIEKELSQLIQSGKIMIQL